MTTGSNPAGVALQSETGEGSSVLLTRRWVEANAHAAPRFVDCTVETAGLPPARCASRCTATWSGSGSAAAPRAPRPPRRRRGGHRRASRPAAWRADRRRTLAQLRLMTVSFVLAVPMKLDCSAGSGTPSKVPVAVAVSKSCSPVFVWVNTCETKVEVPLKVLDWTPFFFQLMATIPPTPGDVLNVPATLSWT